jgi:hypothetical protein
MTGGSISGRVTDVSEAAIPGATVTIENQNTGQKRTLKADEKGFYSASNLTPGRYEQLPFTPGLAIWERRTSQSMWGRRSSSTSNSTLG